MAAILLTGHGGFNKLEYRTDVPTPQPGAGEVVVRVAACGLNNTDINTRIGWYSPAVRSGVTEESAAEGSNDAQSSDGGWEGALRFPLIQGADVCGYVAAVGPGVDPQPIGARVLIDPWILADAARYVDGARYFGSEVNGGFAQFAIAPGTNVYPINSPLSDAELATFACAYSTAENLATHAAVSAADVVVITGASGGVGSALVQTCRLRGAFVIAIAAVGKAAGLRELGADVVVDRASSQLAADVRTAAGGRPIDAICDVVGATMFERLVPLLRPGGHYASSGAIAGPIVEFDLRWLIYADLHFSGATVCPPGTFAKVVAGIESGRLRPHLAATFPMRELVQAQQMFLAKNHIGNIVVIPPFI
jgi:NADPH:quinone reductase-like Zn-dependent oxidoreductase